MQDTEEGFTLIEVLVSFALTSLVMLVVMNGVQLARLRQLKAVQLLEASQLAQAILQKAAFEPNATDVSGEAGRLQWQMQLHNTGVPPRMQRHSKFQVRALNDPTPIFQAEYLTLLPMASARQ